MQNHFLYPLFRKLRPQAAARAGMAEYEPFLEFAISVYLLPLAVISLVWLALATEVQQITSNLLPLTCLGLALFFIQRKQAIIPFQIAQETQVTVHSSLSSIALWSGILIWGEIVLWVHVLVSLLRAVEAGWHRSHMQQDPLWRSLVVWLQETVGAVLGGLLVINLYWALGGTLPFSSVATSAWLSMLAILLLYALLSSLLILPILVLINRLINPQIPWFKAILGMLVNVSLASLVTTPFALLFTLLYTLGSLEIYLFSLLALVLVNLLAHYLSMVNQRSLQRTREMSELEALGQAILKAPADGSTLPEILRTYLGRMFPTEQDWVEIRVFPGTHLDGFNGQVDDLQIVYPADRPALPQEFWQQLLETDEPHLVIPAVRPQGMKAVYGDAVLDKITDASPGQEAADTCIGGVYLLRHHRTARTVDSLPAVQALASQIATALYRAQVYAETLASQKMAQELEFAGRIQASFLPEQVPAVTGWQISAGLIPARQTAGDFYDFIPLEDGHLGLLVADVADKGTGAALYMALSRTLLRTYALQYPEQPAEVLRWANERILADTRANQFVTVFYAVLDPASGELVYANAGHNPALHLFANGNGSHRAYIRTGPPLGIFGGLTWEQANTRLLPGEALLLYSDGVTEAQNDGQELFGEQRLLAAAQSHRAADSAGMQAAILAAVHDFVAGAAQFDDITLMVVQREA